MRTTDPVSSQFNMLNMYIGIALIALPKAVSEVGFIAAITGLIFVNMISLGASYFLLKARNRYKRVRIIDFPDLAQACYGDQARILCEAVLILTNTTFAMAQGMYLGGQADLFACSWFGRPDECGQHQNFYSFVMIGLMSPILLIPDFKKLSAFSGFFILCCIVSIVFILGFEAQILYERNSSETAETYTYEMFNFTMFPLFMGEVLSIFEGNVGILNIYSQQNEPRSMIKQAVVTHLIVLVMCILIGTLSYLAYGSDTKDVILYNLPQSSQLATIVALLYMLNIVGSIAMTVQPIYALFEKGEQQASSNSGNGETTNRDENNNMEDGVLSQTDASTIILDGEELTTEEVNLAASLDRRDNQPTQGLSFYVRRLSIPFLIIAMSTFFPNVNLILSLLGGSVCGVFFIVMPVFFYRQAYIARPSRKSRWTQIILGNLIVAITIPIGVMGVIMNVQKMLAEEPEEIVL